MEVTLATGSADFAECEAVLDERPVRQGDLFEGLSPIVADPWNHLGIVVTADCDIARDKHAGFLSYVPVLDVRDYLRLFFLPTLLERASRPVAEETVAALREAQRAALPDFPEPLSRDAALTWIEREEPATILRTLNISSGSAPGRLDRLLPEWRTIRAAQALGTYAGLFEALLDVRCRGGGDRAKLLERLQADIASKITDLPGDSLFLGTVLEDRPKGFVAYLRLVREIRGDEIALKHADLRSSSVRAKRIARLTSPYIYRLTQQLGDVFSSVGLPTEYEDHRRAVLKALHPLQGSV